MIHSPCDPDKHVTSFLLYSNHINHVWRGLQGEPITVVTGLYLSARIFTCLSSPTYTRMCYM